LLVAPPKRKTGGSRVTPKGTKPGQLPRATPPPVGGSSTPSSTHTTAGTVASSSRYTPPIPKSVRESPKWVPILMLALIIAGVGFILARYLLSDSIGNWPLFVGLGLVLAGLYTATKWH
jgi:Cell division protein CrgA